MTSYSPLAFPDPEAPEAPEKAPEKAPEASKTWSFRVVSGLLFSAAVAVLCVGKLWPLSGAQDADVLASQMKMGNYFYPPCPTGTFHQCPEHWDAGYHCLHGMTYHHAKSYQKYNCRHLNEGPFPLNECLNQCRIGHFGKGRWASHAWENAGDTVHMHVVHHYYDDGSDYMNGKGPALVDGFVDDGSDYMNGKGPAPVDGFVDDGSDYGPAPVDGFVDDGSDYEKK